MHKNCTNELKYNGKFNENLMILNGVSVKCSVKKIILKVFSNINLNLNFTCYVFNSGYMYKYMSYV